VLQSIKIENFKAIKKVELNKLAPINYLIGPNGSGKSSVLEVLFPSIFTFNKTNLDSTESFPLSIYGDNTDLELFYKKYFNLKLKFSGENLVEIIRDNNKLKLIKECKIDFYSNIYCNIPNNYANSKGNIVSTEEIINEIDSNYRLKKQAGTGFELQEIIKDLFGIYPSMGMGEDGLYLNNINENSREKVDFRKIAHGLQSLYKLIRFIYFGLEPKIIVLIEEPETGLHPKWQKEIPMALNFILKKYIEEKIPESNLGLVDIKFIISTHSPFIINQAINIGQSISAAELVGNKMYGSLPSQKVYHLENGICIDPEGFPKSSGSSTVAFDNVLNSIGVKPSDLMFANGVVWVEGPSDAVYIGKWLEMYAREMGKKVFKPGLDYQFQMYGGQLLDYLYFEEEDKLDKITNLFYLNRNFYVITDNDFESAKSGEEKIKSKFENAKDYFEFKIDELRQVGYSCGFWKETNTQISTIEFYMKKGAEYAKYKINSNVFKPDSPKKDLTTTYSRSKGANSYLVTKRWNDDIKLSHFESELKIHIEKLYNTIKSWN
jgi:AAA15 family ATPase/GTPase